MVTLRWDLTLTLVLAWTIVFLCLIKGIKSSGKVVYVTATLPYILLTVLLIQGATMDGSLEGVIFYIKPDFKKLANLSVWAEACGQIFFSLGAAWGGLLTMASYNRFNTNIYRFSVVVPLINCGTSLYAGFVIFSVLGYMAKQAGVRVEDIVDSGPGLIFVAYPYAISNLPVPQLWAVLFFLMILSVGVDSQFGMFETFTTCIFDEFSNIFTTRLRKLMFTGGVVFMAFLLGLFCCTHSGIYFFQLMDWYIGIFTLLFISCIECLIIGWVYGVDRMYENIELMIGYKPIGVWKWMWKVVTPVMIVVMLIYSLATYKAPVYKKTVVYPAGAIGLAWIYALSSSLPTPAYAVYLLVKTRNEGLTLWERIKKYSLPSPEWGSKEHHKARPEHEDMLPEENMPLNEVQSDEKPPQYNESEKEGLTNSTEKLPRV